MGRIGLEEILTSTEETVAFGKKMAALLKPNTVLALTGDLGSGKTTFVQGLALGLGIEDPVQSPTFVTLNLYDANTPLFHFDLYRLQSTEDFLNLGFEEYFQSEGICAIEWPERISSLLPPDTIQIKFEYTEQGRKVTVC